MKGIPAIGQLPQNWVIEWERWIATDPARPNRSARKIDTELAPTLGDMRNQGNDPALGAETRKLFKHLARRNLRRGYRLNLPTAQACIAGGRRPRATSPSRRSRPSSCAPARRPAGRGRRRRLRHGDAALVLHPSRGGGTGGGEHLGPLGSHIVANTLVGLIVNDEDSYWNADGGRWSPAEFNPANPIDSLEDMVRFCGML